MRRSFESRCVFGAFCDAVAVKPKRRKSSFRSDACVSLLWNDGLPAHRDGWLWLHFNLADARVSGSLASLDYLPQPARESLIAEDDHQQLHADDACVYGVFADIVREGANLRCWQLWQRYSCQRPWSPVSSA